jgi:hypothetical protein
MHIFICIYTYIYTYIYRLFFYAALETIRTGDVYNPGGGGLVPHLHMIDSLISVPLGSLDMMESFRLVSDPTNRFDILGKDGFQLICRDVEGYITKMDPATLVRLGGNLTRRYIKCNCIWNNLKISIPSYLFTYVIFRHIYRPTYIHIHLYLNIHIYISVPMEILSLKCP